MCNKPNVIHHYPSCDISCTVEDCPYSHISSYEVPGKGHFSTYQEAISVWVEAEEKKRNPQ